MKKLIYLLLILSIVSCTNNESSIEDDFGVNEGSSSSTSSGSSEVTLTGGLVHVSTQTPSISTSTTTTIEVMALDSDNAPEAGVAVTFSLRGSTGGLLSRRSATTAGNGIATTVFTAPGITESPTVLATSENGTASFFITVGSSGASGPTYSDITFAGVEDTTVIDDEKVRVFFDSPQGGSGIMAFRVYLDSDFTTPHQSFGLGLYEMDSTTGNLYVDVSNLTAATAYDFSVRVFDIVQGEEDDNTATDSATTAAAVAPFGGIDDIDQETSTSMVLNWSEPASATRYDIYNVTTGTPVYYGTTSAGNDSYSITGLEPGTSYVWRVRYVNGDNIQDDNTNDVTESTSNSLSFAGASSITNLTSTSLQVNWTHVAGAASYKLYLSSDLSSPLQTITAPINYVVVGSLDPGTSYSYVVRATDDDGGEDNNSVTVTDTTPTITVTHAGWSDVYSVGPRVDFEGNETEKENIILKWKQMSASAGTLSGYNISYSSSEVGGYTQINTAAIADLGGADMSYVVPVEEITSGVDLVPGTVYWFHVTAIVNGTEITPEVTTNVDHTTIRVVYPPNNMALVHRWIANENTCDQYGKGFGSGDFDLTEHYRCEFDGLGSTDVGGTRYYDIGKDLLVDVNELGCNFSQNACPSHSVGTTTTTDCIGNAAPGSTEAPKGTVWWSRYQSKTTTSYSGGCYVQTADDASNPVWKYTYDLDPINDISYGSANAFGEDMAANKVNLPSINSMTPHQAYRLCEAQTVNLDLQGSDTEFHKRTLRKKEFAAASMWPSSLSTTDMHNLETDITADSCNTGVPSRQGNDNLDEDFEDEYWIIAKNGDGNYNDPRKPTGTTDTRNCRSRYGIQDMVGNVAEIVSDHIQCKSSNSVCSMSTSVTTPLFDSGYQFDWQSSIAYWYMHTQSGWAFTTNTNGAQTVNNTSNFGYLNAALAIPLKCSNNMCNGNDDKDLTPTNYLYNILADQFYSTYSNDMYGFAVGGARRYAAAAGRYATSMINFSNTSTNNENGSGRTQPRSSYQGTRCMFPYSY